MASLQAKAATTLKPVDGGEKLSLWRKIGYGMGDIFGGGSSTIISFYYLIFLTDVVLINPALAGTVILISKIYDAITDPFEGVISDRTRTRLGRRRPYLLAGMPLIFLSFAALFYPIDLSQEFQRFIFVVLTYLFFSTVVSIVMLNYNALQSEMTLDYNERTSLSSARIFFSTLASIICAVGAPGNRQGFPGCSPGLERNGIGIWRLLCAAIHRHYFRSYRKKRFSETTRKIQHA